MRRFILAAAMMAACGGDDSGGPLDVHDLQDAAINAFCNLYVRCGLIDDAQTCRALDLDLNANQNLVAAVDAGKVIYHEDKARECLAGLTGATCDRNRLFTESEACDQTFEGTVAAGGMCALDEECISQQCDVPACPDACCQGTCVGGTPPVRPRVGESCATNPDCVSSFCDQATTTCTAYRTLGMSCTGTDECAEGDCLNGTCTAMPGPGEACSVDLECRDIGTICSPTSMTCVPLGLTGDPCTTRAECSPIYTCSTAGQCELGATLGEPCGTTTGTSCIDNSYCEPTTSRCTAPKADNQMCSTNRECASNNCDSATNTCQTRPICI